MNEIENTGSHELIHTDEFNLGEKQMLEQIYAGAGLEPVVEAGIKDYDEKLQKENKLLNKVLGTRGSDIKGYGEAVAKRVAYAVYQMLNRQYGGKMGDLKAYINSLQDERDRSKDKYDDLMGRVVGILGEEYKELRTDSKEFMQKLTTTLGEDLKESKIDQQALAETLADIDGLRNQIKQLKQEKISLIEGYEEKIAQIYRENEEKAATLKEEIDGRQQQIDELETEKSRLSGELERSEERLVKLQASAAQIPASINYEEIGKKHSGDLYEYLVKDSKVPHLVLEGVGKFIDFKKYLKVAIAKGAEEASIQAESILKTGNEG